ncbi:hypothetical protein Pla175_48200 [Pirellulimonas nuda]|uniref:Uncharacterized protein n=1 Tax=Pirellulimonas nuda TaxID=2528009 RepID=A0A518DIV2_9BACT|nr:hypothetical protein [Pirellulimonas nuda]QDU91398.1 hypothetical protein Pla175_48200 [Pirellulimonas nuda]
MTTTLLPLADADWLRALAPLLLIIFWVVRQVFEAAKGEKPQPQPGAKKPPVRPTPPAAAAAGRPQNDLRSEVDDFLRRTGRAPENRGPEKRPAAAQPARPPRRPRLELLVEDTPEPPRRKRLSEDQQQPASAPTPTAFEHKVDPQRAVGDRLKHLAESQLAENAAHMGDDIAQSDERLEARLHQTFDHRLGKLQSREQAPAAAVAGPTPAEQLFSMLSTPSGMQQAVLLNEVLRRPDSAL